MSLAVGMSESPPLDKGGQGGGRGGGSSANDSLVLSLCATLLLLAGGCAGNGGGGGQNTATPTVTATLAVTTAPTAEASATPTEAATAEPTATVVPTDAPTGAPTAPPTVAPTVGPSIQAGPLAMRRLTEAQYRASIADVLGADIIVAGRIEPDNRRSGLLAVGSSFVSVTSSGFEQYDAIARSVAEQALDPARGDALVPCTPDSRTGPDDACAEAFIRQVGRLLLRRPLADEDVELRVAIAADAARTLGDFYAGLETVLTTFLLSPEFLFRVELAEPDPNRAGRQRLTSLAMASRLAFFLWNTAPDEELLDAAERGELVDDAGLAFQVERMLDSPRLAASVRAFFSDLYSFEEIEQGLVRKDPALFPSFSHALIDDAREQTLRVIEEHLLTAGGDYRDLFTTRKSFMTRTLGLVYRVPVPTAMGWQPFEFPAGAQRAGLLTHVSLLALHSHPGRSSPTLRGKFVREVLLCQYVPPPPGDIDFSMFADTDGANRRTARERLIAHVENEACSGCHSLMDPIGLALEKMDGIGAYRETENGVAIDASGELNGAHFGDAIGLGEALSRDPLLGPCLIESLFKYAVGRDPVPGEGAFLYGLQSRMEESGYRLRDLMRLIVMSDAFRTTSGTRTAEETVPPTPEAPYETPTAGPTGAPTEGTTPLPTPTVDPNAPPTSPPTPVPTSTPAASLFPRIQDEIFTPNCATQFCHSQQVRSGNLVLEAGQSFGALVSTEPANVAARAAGMLRVDPFSPENSFLIMKLGPISSSAFGARMPLIGSPLSAEEIDLIRDWILAGANQ
jgi:hypothetical protein